MKTLTQRILAIVLLLAGPCTSLCAEDKPYTRQEDVVYGRLYGTALTMDVITPRTSAGASTNGAAVIWVVSGGWVSSHDLIAPKGIDMFAGEFVKRGYTVFFVCHGCQPRFTIPEITPQISRAVRYIRHHAPAFHIDPQRIGICGASAGAHLSLMQGVAPQAENPNSPDPIDRQSSKVQAVGCFFPLTDLLNYGQPGRLMRNHPAVAALKLNGAFDYHELDPANHMFIPITDASRLADIEKQISPLYHITPDDPPILIIHGDADVLVPLEQSQRMIQACQQAAIPAKLITRPGKGHGWPDINPDLTEIADWFDRYLANPSPTTTPTTH